MNHGCRAAANSGDIASDLALQAERLQPPRLGIARAPGTVQLIGPAFMRPLVPNDAHFDHLERP